jgi:hypothetical protein
VRTIGSLAVLILLAGAAGVRPALADDASRKQAGDAAPAQAGGAQPGASEQTGVSAEAAAPSSLEWLHLLGGVGYHRLQLRTFFAEDSDTERLTADIVPEDMSGPSAWLALGTKLWFVGLDLTGRVTELSGAAAERGTSNLTLWSLDAEVTFRAPLGRFEPFVLLGAGYSTFGGMSDLAGIGEGLDIDGMNLRGGFGLDYYLTRMFSLRVALEGDLLFLARKGVPARDLTRPKEVGTLNEAEARILEADGSSAGFGYGLSAGAGVHF